MPSGGCRGQSPRQKVVGGGASTEGYGPDVLPEPAVPRPAATVLLLRDAPGLEVFLQRRVKGMAFAGGMTVFPGGGVAAADHAELAWTGPDRDWWSARLGLDAALAAATVVAAVRETFEECGVLLAGPGELPESARADLVAGRAGLTDVLGPAGLAVRADLLQPWARWITPASNPRRYDTVFLAARVPDGQVADAHTTEAVEAQWWRPADALAEWDRDGMQLMPPTIRTLQEIAEYPDTAAVLAAAAEREIRPIQPDLVRRGDLTVATGIGGPEIELRGQQ